MRWAVVLGLASGTLWTLFEDQSGRTTEVPAEPPQVIALSDLAADAPLKKRLAANRPVPKVATAPEPELSTGWAIPAGAIDPKKATLDTAGEHLVQDLPDGTRVVFTLDPKLQRVATETLARYDVEWGAVVAIRPQTGEILAMAEHAKGRPELSRLSLSAAGPAASIFKVISSAALLEHAKLSPDQEICTHGGQNKLTLYNLKANKRLDTKCETFAEALGSSNNVAFARWADSLLTPQQLQQTAEKFLFTRRIPFPWAVGISQARIPFGSRLGFARAAAGFEATTLSPLHAAMITAAVGHEGKMMAPQLIASATQNGEVVYTAAPTQLAEVLSPEHAKTLTGMLEATMTHGTGKKFFEKKGVPRLGKVRSGGKSGSLSGRHEDTRRHFSWFVALAPIDNVEVAVAALVVHGENWTVKGAVPAREVLAAYFGNTSKAETGSDPAERDPLAE
jgi:cell division protein FtsI/penicillin-binding protein 2